MMTQFNSTKFLLNFFAILFIIVPVSVYGQDEDDEYSENLPGIIAQYQDTKGHSIKRIDERVSFKWIETKPDPRLAEGNFYAQWNGLLETSADGEYQFHFYGSVEKL